MAMAASMATLHAQVNELVAKCAGLTDKDLAHGWAHLRGVSIWYGDQIESAALIESLFGTDGVVLLHGDADISFLCAMGDNARVLFWTAADVACWTAWQTFVWEHGRSLKLSVHKSIVPVLSRNGMIPPSYSEMFPERCLTSALHFRYADCAPVHKLIKLWVRRHALLGRDVPATVVAFLLRDVLCMLKIRNYQINAADTDEVLLVDTREAGGSVLAADVAALNALLPREVKTEPGLEEPGLEEPAAKRVRAVVRRASRSPSREGQCGA
eukprot:TRINITY_DN662_c0_g2_i1.p1 TRINITY_DN662_c0_g2~~TRINITY_DN662_c0_g2_i1.p1  ORF type:complete len:269 (+),score=68.26 TRINITY_DN662_c0_g2_i1:43-849(+)